MQSTASVEEEDEVLSAAQRVLYVDSDKALLPAQVLRVHRDDFPPYYTINVLGTPREKQTVRERLLKVPSRRGVAVLDAAEAAAARTLPAEALDAANDALWTRDCDVLKWVPHWSFLVSLGLLARHLVSLHSHSGRHQAPMFGDYEAQRHWMEIALNTPLRDWYFDTEDNDLEYWGLDYPPLSAYFAWLVGVLSRSFEAPSVELLTSRGYDTASHRAFMRASVYLVDLVVYIPAALLLATTLFSKAPVDAGRGALDANFLARILSAASLVLCPSLLLIDHGHFQYNGVCIGLAMAALACMLRKMRWATCILFSLSLNFKQMSLFYAPVFGCALLGWCMGLEAGTGTDEEVDAENKLVGRRRRLEKHAQRMERQGVQSTLQMPSSRPLASTRRFLWRSMYLGTLVLLTFAVVSGPFCVGNIDRESLFESMANLKVRSPQPKGFDEMLADYDALHPLAETVSFDESVSLHGQESVGDYQGSAKDSTETQDNSSNLLVEVGTDGATVDATQGSPSGRSRNILKNIFDRSHDGAAAAESPAGQKKEKDGEQNGGALDERTEASVGRNESVEASRRGDTDEQEQETEANMKPSWVSTVMSTVSRVVKRFVAESSAQLKLALSSAGAMLRGQRHILKQYVSVTTRYVMGKVRLQVLRALETGAHSLLFAAESLGFGPPESEGRGCTAGLKQVVHRVFPIARGLFEDKVANFWYVLSIPVDFRAHLEKSSLALLALGATLLCLLPMIALLLFSVPPQPVKTPSVGADTEWTASVAEMSKAIEHAAANPIERRTLERNRKALLRQRNVLVVSGGTTRPSPRGAALVICAAISALACFLFGFQVHEKSILLASVPIAALLPLDAGFVLLMESVACYSMFPLLERDGLTGAYMCIQVILLGVTVLHGGLELLAFVDIDDLRDHSDGWIRKLFTVLRGPMRGVLHVFFVGIMATVHLLHALVPPPETLPHIYPLMFSTSAFAIFVYALVYLNVWLCALLGN